MKEDKSGWFERGIPRADIDSGCNYRNCWLWQIQTFPSGVHSVHCPPFFKIMMPQALSVSINMCTWRTSCLENRLKHITEEIQDMYFSFEKEEFKIHTLSWSKILQLHWHQPSSRDLHRLMLCLTVCNPFPLIFTCCSIMTTKCLTIARQWEFCDCHLLHKSSSSYWYLELPPFFCHIHLVSHPHRLRVDTASKCSYPALEVKIVWQEQ